MVIKMKNRLTPIQQVYLVAGAFGVCLLVALTVKNVNTADELQRLKTERTEQSIRDAKLDMLEQERIFREKADAALKIERDNAEAERKASDLKLERGRIIKAARENVVIPEKGTPEPAPVLSCDPSYPTICIPPNSSDLNCPDIPHRRFTVQGADTHGFDRDNDGVGCES